MAFSFNSSRILGERHDPNVAYPPRDHSKSIRPLTKKRRGEEEQKSVNQTAVAIFDHGKNPYNQGESPLRSHVDKKVREYTSPVKPFSLSQRPQLPRTNHTPTPPKISQSSPVKKISSPTLGALRDFPGGKPQESYSLPFNHLFPLPFSPQHSYKDKENSPPKKEVRSGHSTSPAKQYKSTSSPAKVNLMSSLQKVVAELEPVTIPKPVIEPRKIHTFLYEGQWWDNRLNLSIFSTTPDQNESCKFSTLITK